MLLAAVGPGHVVAGFRSLIGAGVSAASLVVRIKSQRLLPSHWKLELGPCITDGLLAGRAGSCSLAEETRDPQSLFQIVGWGCSS